MKASNKEYRPRWGAVHCALPTRPTGTGRGGAGEWPRRPRARREME
jgi:hypothetical protein